MYSRWCTREVPDVAVIVHHLWFFFMLVSGFCISKLSPVRLLGFVLQCFDLTNKLVIPFQMSNITVTYRDGRVAQLEQVYIRGSKIRFLILPDMLKNAPMLKSMKNKNQGSGAGRGKAAILKAQGRCPSGTGFRILLTLFLLGKALLLLGDRAEPDCILATLS